MLNTPRAVAWLLLLAMGSQLVWTPATAHATPRSAGSGSVEEQVRQAKAIEAYEELRARGREGMLSSDGGRIWAAALGFSAAGGLAVAGWKALSKTNARLLQAEFDALSSALLNDLKPELDKLARSIFPKYFARVAQAGLPALPEAPAERPLIKVILGEGEHAGVMLIDDSELAADAAKRFATEQVGSKVDDAAYLAGQEMERELQAALRNPELKRSLTDKFAKRMSSILKDRAAGRAEALVELLLSQGERTIGGEAPKSVLKTSILEYLSRAKTYGFSKVKASEIMRYAADELSRVKFGESVAKALRGLIKAELETVARAAASRAGGMLGILFRESSGLLRKGLGPLLGGMLFIAGIAEVWGYVYPSELSDEDNPSTIYGRHPELLLETPAETALMVLQYNKASQEAIIATLEIVHEMDDEDGASWSPVCIGTPFTCEGI